LIKKAVCFSYDKYSPMNKVYEDVYLLSSIRPFRNYKNPASLRKAADYIYDVLSRHTDKVQIQEYSIGANQYRNIIGIINPECTETIVTGAHYDVAGNTPGADDNASGIAGILEIARMLRKERPSYRIELAAYTLEEPPFFGTQKMGSYIHAKSLKERRADLKVMLCLEMIGYFSDRENSQKFPLPFMRLFYPDKGNFIGVIGNMSQIKITRKIRELIKEGSEIPVYSLNAPALLPGIDLSDHRNFWHFGYKAVMITDTAFYRNPHYHQRTDTIKTLDFKRMYEVIKGVKHAILHL